MSRNRSRMKGNKAIKANERRGALRHVLFQSRMWMDVSALRRFVDAKRQVVEQDLKRLAAVGHIEVASLKVFDPLLDRCKIVQMARALVAKPERIDEVQEETDSD